jgi:hypothetical protein
VATCAKPLRRTPPPTHSAVIARLRSGDPVFQRRPPYPREASGILGAPVKPEHDSGEDVGQPSRGMICPGCASASALGEQRAQGMPGVWCTRGLVCSEESTRVRNRGYAEHSGIPCAMVFDVCRALPGVPGSVVTVACICCKLDTSVGVPGPHGFVDRTGRVRLTLPARPSHPAPNVRDDRVAPLLKGTGHRDKYTISDFRKYKYFYGAGWTLRNRLETADADLPDGYPHQISS